MWGNTSKPEMILELILEKFYLSLFLKRNKISIGVDKADYSFFCI